MPVWEPGSPETHGDKLDRIGPSVAPRARRETWAWGVPEAWSPAALVGVAEAVLGGGADGVPKPPWIAGGATEAAEGPLK